MSTFYSISLHEKVANVLSIEKKKSFYNIKDEQVLDLHELTNYLQNKDNFHVVVNTEELLDDVVTVPSMIKTPQLLRNYILKKYKDSLTTKNILLNYNKLSVDKEDETTTYKIDAVDANDYTEKLRLIPSWDKIESATIEKFALYNITKECFSNKEGYGYFSIYTHGTRITVLAIDEKGDLFFERNSQVLATDESTSLFLNMVDEINQTIAYVKQQFRTVSFSHILISGSLALDDHTTQHLLFSTDLAIAVLYPNTFIKGLYREEPQQYIITIGSFLVTSKDAFFPDELHSIKEYNIAYKVIFAIAALLLALSSYFAFSSYLKYDTEFTRYNQLKEELVQLVKTTPTYPLDELETSYKHLQIAEKHLRYHPSDVLVKLKPLVMMQKPSYYSFALQKDNKPIVDVVFSKQFDSLREMYRFKQDFMDKFDEINTKKEFTLNEQTDYAQLVFLVHIKQKASKHGNIKLPPRRRI